MLHQTLRRRSHRASVLIQELLIITPIISGITCSSLPRLALFITFFFLFALIALLLAVFLFFVVLLFLVAIVLVLLSDVFQYVYTAIVFF